MKQRMLNDVALEQLLYFILEQKLNNYLIQMTVLRKNGRQIGITELTKQIFDEKGYAYLQKKKSGNWRDHANMMKTTKTCSKPITKEMLEQKGAENSKDQECCQRPSRQH